MQVNEPIPYLFINAHCDCFNLRKASRAITQFYDHALESAGIRATQFSLLVSMAAVSIHTLTEMADILVMDRTTLTRNLKPLEKLGLIAVITSRDRRSKSYVLTDRGHQVLMQALPLWQAAQNKMVAGLGVERNEYLLKELEALIKVVNKHQFN